MRAAAINITDDGAGGYIIGWSENPYYGNSSVYVVDSHLSGSYVKTILGPGNPRDIQVSNGANFNSMYLSMFQYSSLPYSFSQSNRIGSYYGMSKSDGTVAAVSGRGCTLAKDDVSFMFSLNEVSLNDQQIDFVKVDDSLKETSLKKINKYLLTEPFTLKSNDNLTFRIVSQTDSLLAPKLLGKSGQVAFELSLINDADNTVISKLKSVSFTGSSVISSLDKSFKLNTSSIGNKTVRLKVEAKTNLNVTPYLSERVIPIDPSLAKRANEENVELLGADVVTDYALNQNYPNPFNPSTTINYALPKEGQVTMKVYDVLGKEVATLVNEYKQSGRYSVVFDANRLASGTYIVRLHSSDYVKTMKAILMK